MRVEDKNTEFELSKLQKQIDRGKGVVTTTKVMNITNNIPSDVPIVSKTIAEDMERSDIIAVQKERFIPEKTFIDNNEYVYVQEADGFEVKILKTKIIRGVATFVQKDDPVNTIQTINGDIWIQVRQSQ